MPSLNSILLACLGSIMIGASAIFVRLSDLGPIVTGFYRMLFSLPFLFVWMGWGNKNQPLQNCFPIKGFFSFFAAGAFFAFDLALWNWSIDYTSIVNSTLFNNTAAFFVPLIMWIFFKQKPSLQFIVAACIGFVGCTLLAVESFTISLKTVLGDVVALISGVMVALYLIALKRIRDGISTGLLMFWTGFFSLFFLAFFGWVFGETFWPLSYRDVISILGQSLLVHILGQGILAYSLASIPAAYTALILFLAPVTGAILGWLIYNESLSWLKVSGMILIMLSIVAARNKRERTKA